MNTSKDRSLNGTLWGTAVGDAPGLPAEGLSTRRIRRWWGGTWRMRLLFLLGAAAAVLSAGRPLPSLCWPARLLRNLFFLGVVLLHGFRRLFPPF